MLKKQKFNFFNRLSLALPILLLVFGIISIPLTLQEGSETLSNENISIQSNQGIFINEVYSAGTQWVELINRGPDRVLTGWKLLLYRSPTWIGNAYTYYFPANFIFKQNSLLVILDTSGADTQTTLYTNGNIIRWAATASPNMAALLDEINHSIDHVQWNGWPGPNPPGTSWSGSLSTSNPSPYLYRINNLDTDSAADWSNAASGTQLALNPGQTFPLGDILLNIKIVLNASIFLSEVKASLSVTSGEYLSLSCRITSPLNISNVVALIRNEELDIISIFELNTDGNGIYGGSWLSTNSPLGNYYVDLLVEDNKNIGKIYDDIATFSIGPTFLSQYGTIIWIIVGLSILILECLLLIRYRPRGLGVVVKRILPKWRKTGEPQPVLPEILQHKSGERPYNVGISLNSCPYCKKDLPASTKKQLELGYRVYCPVEGCFHPLFTVTTVQEKAPESAEHPKIRDKVPDQSKGPRIREKIPASSQPTKPSKTSEPLKTGGSPKASGPPKSAIEPKRFNSKQCPHCQHPLSATQLKLKQTGKKVMCRKCMELI